MKMPNPVTTRPTRIAAVDVVGKGWYYQTFATTYPLRDYDLENIEEFTREAFEQWLGTHAGDFSSILDFRARVGREEIPFADEDNECTFNDCMYGGEE